MAARDDPQSSTCPSSNPSAWTSESQPPEKQNFARALLQRFQMIVPRGAPFTSEMARTNKPCLQPCFTVFGSEAGCIQAHRFSGIYMESTR